MGKMIGYNEMLRSKPLTDFIEDGDEVSVGCPVCLEIFLAKVNRRGQTRCSECGNVVDL